MQMKKQCAICYGELEVKDSTPCFVCGCWFEGDELKGELAKDNFTVYALKDDTEVVLCGSCHLEEVVANQGDLLEILNIRYEEAQSGIRFMEYSEAKLSKDKYCLQCNKRGALLKLVGKYAKNS